LTLSGAQGLEWFAALLRVDEDGDVADEFLTERAADGRSGSARGALWRAAGILRSVRGPQVVWTRVVEGWPVTA